MNSDEREEPQRRTAREFAEYVAANWSKYANPTDALESLIAERDRQVGTTLPEVISETLLTSIQSRDYAFTDRCERKCVILSVEERDALCRGVRVVQKGSHVMYFADNAQIYAGEKVAFGSGATAMREKCAEKVEELLRDSLNPDHQAAYSTVIHILKSLTLDQVQEKQ